jgi:4-diphosphocytidyl-2C-methyl-D-erythritol kinase
MASAQNPEKLSSEICVTSALDNPADATVARNVTVIDMRDYENLLVHCTFVSGTGVLTFRLLASGSSTGADTPVLIRAHAAPTVADAAGDTLVLECTAEEMAALATSTCVHPRYVCVEMDNDHADDINSLVYIRSGGKKGEDLTVGVIA